MGAFQDLTGLKFHRLQVLGRGADIGKAPGWDCRCDCGAPAHVRGDQLRKGTTKSCGCYQRDRVTTHGKSRTPEWNSWANMHRRCHDPRDKQFPEYGARGIVVCERWRGNFETFLADMGPRPRGTSIDRIDNNGIYEPANCRWATHVEQQRNKRDSRIIVHEGVAATITEWAERTGFDRTTIAMRLRLGWDVGRALTEAPAPNAKKEVCKFGHPFTPENTTRGGRGSRSCKACNRRRTAEYLARHA